MSNQKDSGNFTLQVAAGALAAATAAVLGSTLGVAGTVLGAGIASVVTTVAATLYLRSIQRTREGVRLVQDKLGRWTGTIPAQDKERAESERTERAEEAEEPASEDRAPATTGRRRWPAVAAASVLAFALGMLALTGLELVRGEQVNGGQGTTIGRLGLGPLLPPAGRWGGGSTVRPDQAPADRQDPAPTAPTTTQPTGTSTVTVTPPTTTQQPEPSPPPTTTTSVPPSTTTTPPAQSGLPIPSGVG